MPGTPMGPGGPAAAAKPPRAGKGTSPLIAIALVILLLAIAYAGVCFLAPELPGKIGIPNVISPPKPKSPATSATAARSKALKGGGESEATRGDRPSAGADAARMRERPRRDGAPGRPSGDPAAETGARRERPPAPPAQTAP